jgi:hypothetical protein
MEKSEKARKLRAMKKYGKKVNVLYKTKDNPNISILKLKI